MGILATTVITGLLIVNSVTDIRKREILLLPTLLVLAGGVIRNRAAFTTLLPGIVLLLLSAAAPGKIGFGDGLAVCAAGVWCGTERILIILFFGLLAVPAAAGILHIRKQRVRELPFIPFLLLGFLVERILFCSTVR